MATYTEEDKKKGQNGPVDNNGSQVPETPAGSAGSGDASEQADVNPYLTDVNALNESLTQQNNETLAEYKENQLLGVNAMSGVINTAVAAREAARLDDEKIQKRERALGIISALGDTLSGLSNFIGVAKGASNQTQAPITPALADRMSAEQKERQQRLQAQMDGIDKLKGDLENLKYANAMGLTEFKAKLDADRATKIADAQKRNQEWLKWGMEYEQEDRKIAANVDRFQIEQRARYIQAGMKAEKADEQAAKDAYEYEHGTIIKGGYQYEDESGKTISLSVGSKLYQRALSSPEMWNATKKYLDELLEDEKLPPTQKAEISLDKTKFQLPNAAGKKAVTQKYAAYVPEFQKMMSDNAYTSVENSASKKTTSRATKKTGQSDKAKTSTSLANLANKTGATSLN